MAASLGRRPPHAYFRPGQNPGKSLPHMRLYGFARAVRREPVLSTRLNLTPLRYPWDPALFHQTLESGWDIKAGLESREMKHSLDDPTQMDTSEAAFDFMESSMQPKRTLYDKKGVGVYKRVFFFTGAKAVKHNMAEVKGVAGSSTFHEFIDISRDGFLKCRVMSCHRCIECHDFHPEKCMNLHRTGPQLLRAVEFKSGSRVEVPRALTVISGS